MISDEEGRTSALDITRASMDDVVDAFTEDTEVWRSLFQLIVKHQNGVTCDILTRMIWSRIPIYEHDI